MTTTTTYCQDCWQVIPALNPPMPHVCLPEDYIVTLDTGEAMTFPLGGGPNTNPAYLEDQLDG